MIKCFIPTSNAQPSNVGRRGAGLSSLTIVTTYHAFQLLRAHTACECDCHGCGTTSNPHSSAAIYRPIPRPRVSTSTPLPTFYYNIPSAKPFRGAFRTISPTPPSIISMTHPKPPSFLVQHKHRPPSLQALTPHNRMSRPVDFP